jgi:hypothetical protein
MVVTALLSPILYSVSWSVAGNTRTHNSEFRNPHAAKPIRFIKIRLSMSGCMFDLGFGGWNVMNYYRSSSGSLG